MRLVGPGDHRRRRLGDDVSLGLFAGGGFGDDPVSAVLAVIEVVVIVAVAPVLLIRGLGRSARGRREARRLATALR